MSPETATRGRRPDGGDEPPSLELYGRALRDYHAGDRDAVMLLHSSLGEHDEIPASLFFREPDDFFPFEEAALALARGRILDAGAGTGVHALRLERRGLDVTAVEIVAAAAEIMRDRGVRRVVEGDMFELDLGRFDTVLMLMNGIGPVGTLVGLERFLERAGRLLRPGGQILVDSGEALVRDEVVGAARPADTTAARPADAAAAAASSQVPEAGRGPEAGGGLAWPGGGSGYPGEAWIRLEYRGEIGAPFRELYVDAETFARRARGAGWRFEPAYEEGGGSYLARLTRSGT